MSYDRELKRIDGLIKGIHHHAEQIATDYKKARDTHGVPFEDALVALGHERVFLRALYDIGAGDMAPCMAFVDPAKRNILRDLPLAEQTRIFTEGVKNQPLDSIPADELRASIGGIERVKKGYGGDADGRAKERQNPKVTWTMDADGVNFYRPRFTWAALAEIMAAGERKGFIASAEVVSK